MDKHREWIVRQNSDDEHDLTWTPTSEDKLTKQYLDMRDAYEAASHNHGTALLTIDRLLEALKRECCCTGERSELAPYDYITCDACDTVAAYTKSSPTERDKMAEEDSRTILDDTIKSEDKK